MIAHKSNLEALAAFNGVRDAGAPDNKASVLDGGEVFQCFEFFNKGIFLFVTNSGAEFEKNWIVNLA